MTSSENLPRIQSWAFRPTLPDSWLSEAFARDAETLTKALQKSFSNNENSVPDTFAEDLIVPLMNQETSAVSNISGSDHETLPKRQRSTLPPNSGKITKRKSRASKRTQTTFITADPANFRQMVQQVTGVRFGNTQFPMAPILKPEPQRPGSRLPGLGAGGGGGCLPTLDTSAFLLDHQHQPVPSMGPSSSGSIGGPIIGSGQFGFQSSLLGDGHGVSAGLDFETLSSFPTLESWKVM